MLRVLVRAEVGEDPGGALRSLDVACHPLHGPEQCPDVDLVVGADGCQRGEMSFGNDHEAGRPEGPRVVEDQDVLVLADNLGSSARGTARSQTERLRTRGAALSPTFWSGALVWTSVVDVAGEAASGLG